MEENIIIEEQQIDMVATDMGIDVQPVVNTEVGMDNAEMIEIPMGEAFPYISDDGWIHNHALMYGRELSNQHPIEAITGLQDTLNEMKELRRVYAKGNSYAEFKKWNDGNPSAANRAGYFVYTVPNSENIAICGEADEVYGVTTTDAGFVSNQDDTDKSDDWTYAMVSLIGSVKVRADNTVHTGDYVIPNAYGEATKSENNYGYKVLSMGSYPEYNYAIIALVPQSSTLNKILGSLSDTQLNIGDILIELDNIGSIAHSALDNAQIAIDTSKLTAEELEAILKELAAQQTKIASAETVLKETQAQVQEVQSTASAAQSSAVSAAQMAQQAQKEAVASANAAVAEVGAIKEHIVPITEWQDETTGAYGVLGFVDRAETDHATLISIMSGAGPDGSDFTAVKQTQDMIQHLAAHINKYSIGEYSLSYGLSLAEATTTLMDTYIYVCTEDHTETMDGYGDIKFRLSYAYTWVPAARMWVEAPSPISTAVEYKPGAGDGDLWYCWQPGITQTKDNGELVTIYEAGTLYRWTDGKWIAVATTAENYQGRIASSFRQTAQGLRSDITTLDGRASTIQQEVDSIQALVGDNDGNGSTIIQRVGSIESDVYNKDGIVSSIKQQVEGNSATITEINAGRFHVVYQSFLDPAPAAVGNKYTERPMWDDAAGVFVFNNAYKNNTSGKYYFYNDDHTKYCYVTDEGYDIYTVGNQATAMVNNRIDDTEARIDLMAEYDDTNTENIAALVARTDANEASINSVATRYNHTLLEVSTDKVTAVGSKYKAAPEWDNAEGKYKFNSADKSSSGTYYMADANAQTYCHVVKAGDGSTLYEIYGVAGSTTAALQQKVTDQGAVIGLVADNDGLKSSVVLQAIDGMSNAAISADKIDLSGYATFTSLSTKGKTTINGDNVTTGTIAAARLELSEYVKVGNLTDGQTVISGNNITTGKISASRLELSEYVKVGNLTDGTTTISGNNITTGKISAARLELSEYVKVGNLTDGTTTISGNNITTGTIAASRVDLSNYATNNSVKSTIDSSVKGMTLSASNGEKSSTITLNYDGVGISSQTIQFKGDVVFKSDLSSKGSTTIHGGNITTGTIAADRLDLAEYVKVGNLADGITVINGNNIKTGTISADRLELSGYVKVDNLTDGITVINGANIKTGKISADCLELGNYLKIGDLIIDGKAQIHGGNITQGTVSHEHVDTSTIHASSGEIGAFTIGDSLSYTDTSTGNYIIMSKTGFHAMGQSGYCSMRIGGNFSAENASISGQFSGTFTGTVTTTSDRNQKNTIAVMEDKYGILFDNLVPSTFKYNDDKSGKLHVGFIAQGVKSAMDIAGISPEEFGGLAIIPHEDGTEDWGLCYDEFIAINTREIQKLKARVAELEAIIKEK